jgi:DNA-binding CsgD family transcriptional regulator
LNDKTELQFVSALQGDGTPRLLLPHPLDRLTELEIRTLVLVYERNTAKDIARVEGVSPDAIVARINRARNKLGGISRLAAARQLVSAIPAGAYHSMVPYPMGMPDNHTLVQQDLASSEGLDDTILPHRLWRLPLSTKTRPVNDDSILARIIWPIVVAILIVMMMAILQAVMVGINRLRL